MAQSNGHIREYAFGGDYVQKQSIILSMVDTELMTTQNPESSGTRTELVYIINSLHTGGAEIGMCRLLDGLDQREYDVTVISLDGHSEDLTDQTPPWVRVIDLRLRSGPNVSTLRALYSPIRTADVIVGSLYHSSMVARLAQVVNLDATIATWQHADQFITNFRRRTFRWTAGFSDVILADSEPVAEMLISELGLDSCLVHTVPIAGIDLQEYTPVTHQNSTDITVGTIGRLAKQKNITAVLDVAEQFHDSKVRFEIAGDGELYDELQAQIGERGLSNVSLLGFVENIPSFLANLDIYFQPSLWEGLCITVLEAMAAELPIVGSAVGGIQRTVQHEQTGFLRDPEAVDQFVSDIQTLGDNPTLRSEFGRKGRNIVEHKYTKDVLIEEFETAIQNNHIKKDQMSK